MKKNIVFLALFIQSALIFAQTTHFRHLSLEDGLSQNTVNCIFQDSQGFMWFGTQDGLNRYDGYEFTVFRENPLDTNSLSHSWIWYVFEDKNRNLWIATWEGLTKFNPASNTFKRYFHNPQDPHSIGGTRPTSICQDKAGNLWIGTWGGGISKYIPEKDYFETYRHDPNNKNSIPNNFVRSLFYEDDTLWVGTWGGLAKLENISGGNPTITSFCHNRDDKNSLSCDRVTSVLRDVSGVLWVGTFGGGLNRFNESLNIFQAFTNDVTESGVTIGSNDVSFIYEDRHQNLWIATLGGGLNRIDKTRKKVIHSRYDANDDGTISGNKIYSILQDRSGLMWIGGDGLNIYDISLERFKHIKSTKNKINSLSNNKVWAFYEDNRKKIWIGTEGGLNRYDPETENFLLFEHNPDNPLSLSSNRLSSIIGDRFDNLWIGTLGGGLNYFVPATGQFKVYNSSLKMKNSDGIDYIVSLCLDEDVLWIATYDKGLLKLDLKRQLFDHFEADSSNENSIPGNYLSVVFKDSKGNIWLGFWGGGLCLLKEGGKRFIHYLHNRKDSTSIPSNIVHSIYEYQDKLWVGTNNGLSNLDLNKEDSIKFNHINGLPSNVIYGLLSDHNNNLWISTNKGIVRYNLKTKRVRNFTREDGLQSDEFNASACLRRKNGQLLFGGVNGFNLFHPDSIRDNLFRAPLVITSFKVFDKPYYFDDSGKIYLSYKQNFFSFEFASLDYSKPKKNRYAYKMVGFDLEWIYSGTRRYASYTNLDPGEYVFKVKGTNGDGIWNNQGTSIGIVIVPPFWQTWWFRFLIVFMFLITLYGLYHYRVSKLLELERLRVQIASDLHDDIGSALTRISVYSEAIQITKDENKIKQMSQKIGSVSREIITTMSDIVWSIDARNDLAKNLLDRMKDFAFNLLSEKDIRLTFIQKGLEPNKKLSVAVRRNLYLIFKEAINNIVKHSDATSVEVKLLNIKNTFQMFIRDNGQGFDPNSVKQGNGIKNMKLRAERVNADLTIHTQKGVEVTLTMEKI